MTMGFPADIFIFFVGASIGSFLSVVLARLGRRKGIVAGRSECPRCGYVLKWLDLIPVVSFVLLRRRCRRCKAPIPWSYLALEVTMGSVLAVLIARQDYALTSETAFLAIMLIGFVALFFFDFTYFVLPDRITLPLIAIALAYRIVADPALLTNALITAFALAAIFAILYVLSGGTWIGFGDVKLMVILGLVFGYPVGLFVVICAIWLAAIVGIGMLLTGRATSQTALPFGSFLTCVAVVSIIFYHESDTFIRLFF
jgi:leader peptidase (prepilin peptidase)/N-methyltransferase